MALAVSCNDPVVDDNGEINPPQPEMPQPRPDEPASIELSNLYAASKAFEVKEEQPSELYSEWLGEWVFKGDNGVSNNVTISQKTANREIYFSGLAELAPASSAKAVRYSVGKNLLPTATPQFSLGNKIESARF